MMLIVKSKQSNGYLPRHDIDLPMFMHCTGYMEVRDIRQFISVFNAHGIQIMVQDETATNPQNHSDDKGA